jgi:hypothetical protein
MTHHERVERSGSVAIRTIRCPFVDQGFHCYSCGHDWGFAFQRDRTWVTSERRVVTGGAIG